MSPRPRWLWAGFGIVLLAVVAVQLSVVAAGSGRLRLHDQEFRGTTGYYGMLAHAFLRGRVDLPVDPPAALATNPTPYEPGARDATGALFEASYANGRYTLYFGPAPAVLLATFGIAADLRDVPDLFLGMAALLALDLALAAVVWLLSGRIPPWLRLLALAAVALANPLLFLASRLSIYEAAILWGQAGLVGGVAAALAGRRGGWAWWVLAGVLWAVAIGSRVSLAGAVVVLAVGLAGWPLRVQALRKLALAAIPLLLAAAALGWYNAARYGSPLEFGHRYQLTGYSLSAEYGQFFALAHVPLQLWHLFADPVELRAAFPFASWDAEVDQRPWLPKPETIIIASPSPGLLWAVPAVWLLLLIGRARDHRREPIVLALAALAALAPIVLQRFVAMRYQADAVPLLSLAAVAALGAVPPGRLVSAVAAALLLASGAIGASFGMAGRWDHVRRHNPTALGGLVAPERRDGPWDLSQPRGAWQSLGARWPGVGLLHSFSVDPPTAAPGETVRLRLRWVADSLPAPTVRLLVRGLDPRFAEQVVLDEPLETVAWRRAVADAKGEISVQETRLLAIPPSLQGPEYLRLELSLVDRAPLPWTGVDGRPSTGATVLGPLRVQYGTFGRWTPPAGPALRFANGLIVRGAEVGPPLPGEVPITLHWEAGFTGVQGGFRGMTRLELRDSQGRTVASQDDQPGEGWYPFDLWWPGERFVDERSLDLPRGLPGGVYTVVLRVRRGDEWITPDGNPTLGTLRLP